MENYKYEEIFRIESDSIGEIKVPADRAWGAQTQRSLQNFPIGEEKMPFLQIYSLALLKELAAVVNENNGRLDADKSKYIREVAREVQEGKHDVEFPLSVWQTGSGTQSNMNVNEVIANLASHRLGKKVHPNDDVNCSQSSNDTFPTAMHISAEAIVRKELLPSIKTLIDELESLSEREKGVMKLGRTHLQDAVPLAFSQEVSAWISILRSSEKNIKHDYSALLKLAIGGTAVGTGLNAAKNFDIDICKLLKERTGVEFEASENKFAELSSKHAITQIHASMSTLATHLLKIANDIRWLASGPRSGLGELILPANEPGSSIMPGKVNPTQCEAMSMVSLRVIGNNSTVQFAESQGNFELNVYMPLMIYTFIQSARLLSDAMKSFAERCIRGIKVNRDEMKRKLDQSLMLVTALSPKLGYDKAAEIAKLAHKNGSTLLDEVLKQNLLSSEEYKKIMADAFGI